MAAHSKLGASSMHRWANCPGSVRLSEGIPNRSSKYAEEGTLAHEVAAFYLEHRGWPKDADREMIENVKVYTDTVLGDLESSEEGSVEMLVEHRFNLYDIYPGLFGTADGVVYYPSEKLLRVYDLKYGAGIAVEVEENEQLMYYALGALNSTGYPCDEVEIVIVQPRCPHEDGAVRRWRFTSAALIDFAADVVTFARRTEDPNAPIVPGDWCRFCPASGTCPAVHEKAMLVAKEEFRSGLTYDPAKLKATLDALPMLEAWIKSVREFAYGEAVHGRCPPGWKLVAKRPTRRWKNEGDASEVLKMDFALSEDDIFERSMRSPAQIEKLLGKDGKEIMSEFISSESSGLTLAPESDKRPAAKADPKTEFELITD